jgi:GrpB-like predicted nucleotidyltransferase (UPF0157 family)
MGLASWTLGKKRGKKRDRQKNIKKYSPELLKHLAFRDYLISHPDRAQWLASRKIKEDKSANSRAEYIENKSNAYAIITKESLRFRQPGHPW